MTNDDQSIPVDGPITPISKQKIETVQADRWKDMTVGELLDQKSILDNRYVIAASLGNYPLMQQLQVGIYQIGYMIDAKQDGDTKFL